MNKELQLYKKFIDDLVEIKDGVLNKWIEEKGWPNLEENKNINKLLASLKPADKKTISIIASQARESGIHDVLVYLSEQNNMNNLKLTINDTEMATEPYGTELFFDWIARCNQSEWPEHQIDEKYKV